MVFRAVVLSTLLYACETWTLYRRDIQRRESFQERKSRQLLNTHWELRLSNNEILKRARLPRVDVAILQQLLRWAETCRTDGPIQNASNHVLRGT